MEYPRKNNKIVPFPAPGKWIELKSIMLSEISPTQKDDDILALIYGI